MNQYMAFAQKLLACLPSEKILIDEPMKKHTNFELGGPADVMALPTTQAELECVLTLAREEGIPWFIVGNGSNLVVRDGGIRGLVIKLEHLNRIRVEGDCIIADSGAELKRLSELALEHHLTGLEFACGIPGSLGGAVFMNAGAYEGEMSQVLETVTVISPQGEKKVLAREELELGYRTSRVKTHGDVVVEARLKLTVGDYDAIRGKIELLTQKREERQPLEYPSAGSTFKRPLGNYAGKLIQEAGLKGYCLRGAAVSDKHSGFIINKQNATAQEVLELIAYVQQEVRNQFEIQLEPEVLIVGDDECSIEGLSEQE